MGGLQAMMESGGNLAMVQLAGEGGTAGVHEAAAAGIQGGGGQLPHHDAIQRSFGAHDVGGVQAHVGGAAQGATQAMGAEAYATGNHVAFGEAPTLHTAAHEAAHVVQQRAGVALKGGVGEAGDPHERHADAVADAVVAGRSAEGLLSQYKGGGGGGGTQMLVQKDDKEGGTTPTEKTVEPEKDPVKEAEKTPTFTAAEFTDKDKLETLGIAIKAALAMVNKAIAATAKGNAIYTEYMDGGATADSTDAGVTTRLAHVKTGYDAIKKCLEEDTVVFKEWDLPADHKFKYNTTYAYVRAGEKENNMYLGGSFWVAANVGLDSQAGTIVHELSHRLHATKDHHYGVTSSRDSAKNAPETATTNADNYEHMAENS